MHFILITLIVLLLVYVLLLINYRRGWQRIEADDNLSLLSDPAVFITVIIPARNEEENIKKCLDSLVAQSYNRERFEVLVIDDHSTDATPAIVQLYAATNIRLISLKQHLQGNEINSYKKKAIEIAVGLSIGELIVTTDADCEAPPDWLHTIASYYEARKPEMLVMPVAINCSNNFREIFEALDFMTLQGITGAAVNMKMHSMCNGANLAYSKKAFESVSGFKNIDDIASGDDMLLMHKIREKSPTGIFFLKSHEVVVNTRPANSIREFINQRIRWSSKTGKYADKSITIVLVVIYAFNLLILVLLFSVIFGHPSVVLFNFRLPVLTALIAILCFKTIIELYFLYPVALFFNKQRLLWLFPLAQPFHIVYIVVIGLLGKTGRYLWKGRTVK